MRWSRSAADGGEAKAAGVISDQMVWLGCRQKRGELKQKLRVIKIKCTPHRKRIHNGRGGPQQGEFLLIATDLLDLPAEVIALIYKLPMGGGNILQIFQARAGLPAPAEPPGGWDQDPGVRGDHRLHADHAVERRKPTLRTMEMLRFYFTGWATERSWTRTSRS